MSWLLVLSFLIKVLAMGMIVAGLVGIVYYSVGCFRLCQQYQQLADRAGPKATHLEVDDIERFLAALDNSAPDDLTKAMKRRVAQYERQADNSIRSNDTDCQS